ncbi:hypothetical protein EVAR_69992_1 [Eumeta japonica]|uniref:Uncharacterized protein n=1 Tax=Eumeta variegata TaxID=151549 RepID=A0A4C1ZAB5_EUMVA|nr:hypothetical protein EVAR_69992_1 [Eumeta japonica]
MDDLREECAKKIMFKRQATPQTVAKPGLTRNKLMLCVWRSKLRSQNDLHVNQNGSVLASFGSQQEGTGFDVHTAELTCFAHRRAP